MMIVLRKYRQMLTKGLSKLGFNADVFMGRFDDNKYVNTPKDSVKSASGSQDEWI